MRQTVHPCRAPPLVLGRLPPGRLAAPAPGPRPGRQPAAAGPPAPPLAARDATIYQCPQCDERYLGQQRCDDCGTFCRHVGPGGPCPHCDEPVAIKDLITVKGEDMEGS